MAERETIRIIAEDTPQVLVPEGVKYGPEQVEGLWSDETHKRAAQKQEGKQEAGRVSVHEVRVQKLEAEMTHLLQVVERLFNRNEQQANKQLGMQLDEIELAVEINGEGEVSLLGSGAKAGGKGAIKLKFKRVEPH